MQLKSYTQLLKDSWQEFNKDLQTYLLIALIAGAGLYWNLLMDFVGRKSLTVEIISVALYVVFGILALLAILSKVNNQEKRLSVSESIAIAREHFGKVLGTYLLALIIVVLGFIAFIIPGIVLVVMFAFVVPVALFEKQYYLKAAKASMDYVRGYWLQVFTRILFIGLVIGIPISFIGILLDKTIGVKNSLHVQDLLGLLIIPLVVIYDYLLYKDLMAVKSGTTNNIETALNQVEYSISESNHTEVSDLHQSNQENMEVKPSENEGSQTEDTKNF